MADVWWNLHRKKYMKLRSIIKIMLISCVLSLLAYSYFAPLAYGKDACDGTKSELCADVSESLRELLAWSSQPEQRLKEQVNWKTLVQKVCKETECDDLYRSRIRELNQHKELETSFFKDDVALVVDSTTALNIAGNYTGADKAAESIYGEIKISFDHISWFPPSQNFSCISEYSIISRETRVSSNQLTETSREMVYRLRLSGGNCRLEHEILVLRFPAVINPVMFLSYLDSHSQERGQISFYLH